MYLHGTAKLTFMLEFNVIIGMCSSFLEYSSVIILALIIILGTTYLTNIIFKVNFLYDSSET